MFNLLILEIFTLISVYYLLLIFHREVILFFSQLLHIEI